MGGLFGIASKKNCTLDLFFGIDYHSHLGTRRGGMAVYENGTFNRAIHNIENSPFRTKFEKDVEEMKGNMGIGCISDNEPQPLLVQSHLGSYAIATVGKINNLNELVQKTFAAGGTHFLEMSGGSINATELVASLINQKESILEGIRFVQSVVEGSMTVLIMTENGLFAARDKLGRLPLLIGKKEDSYCVASESFSYINLGFEDCKELGPAEIVFINMKEGISVLQPPADKMKICTFLWIYYGYPTATYEGVNVEQMRYRCGEMLAKREDKSVNPDIVAGVPDSGIAHAVGYANESGIPFARPFIKYTPTWPRSFMPANQEQRNLIARMKLIPVHPLIKNRKLLLIDDSIVRGTQLRETTDFLYQSGAKEVHVRPACPPIMFSCKYLNFSRSTSELDLITRRIIKMREGDNVSKEVLEDYANPDSKNYKEMVQEICRQLHFTTLMFHRLDDMLDAVGIEPCKLCTYCWNGKE
ncbi:MAG: amidophosphoribosyltransferase [Spirochaetaceae bacterium]|nr:amidophosphoribosyltransferase [Spirochaetaceae bacterium]MBP5329519.1 amidophosphoribosyltransferase [Spirochaetaceae bacterium]